MESSDSNEPVVEVPTYEKVKTTDKTIPMSIFCALMVQYLRFKKVVGFESAPPFATQMIDGDQWQAVWRAGVNLFTVIVSRNHGREMSLQGGERRTTLDAWNSARVEVDGLAEGLRRAKRLKEETEIAGVLPDDHDARIKELEAKMKDAQKREAESKEAYELVKDTVSYYETYPVSVAFLEEMMGKGVTVQVLPESVIPEEA